MNSDQTYPLVPLDQKRAGSDEAIKRVAAPHNAIIDAVARKTDTAVEEVAMSNELEPQAKANKLIAVLQLLHPELQWGVFPLCDYDQYAEIDAPDELVCFGCDDAELDEGLVDPYSTLMGELCEPSHWGLSVEAAQLIQAHNKVFVAKYPNCDGPRHQTP